MKNYALFLILCVSITNITVVSAESKELLASTELDEPDIVLETGQPGGDLQKPLDLSLPFKIEHDSNGDTDTKSQKLLQGSSLFAGTDKLKNRSVRFDGRVLMTQEQEAEKFRTVDGAGIVINVQR